MKKIVNLIVLLVVLAGLIVGYIVYSNYIKEKEASETEETEDTTVEVLSIDSSSVISIGYEYADEAVSLKKVDDVWQLESDADFPVDQSYPEYMLEKLCYVTATRQVSESLENEADFGMEDPNFTIKYETSGGQEYVFTIGSYNSIAECYYFKISTQDKIYMTEDTVVDAFTYNMLDMTAVDTLPSPEAEDIATVEYVLEGKTYTLTTDSSGADFYTDPYTYFYVGEDGVKTASDGQAAGELMNAVAGTSLGVVTGYKVDAETLESYGLGESKTLVLNVTYNEEVESEEESDASVSVTTQKNYSVNIGRYVADDSTVEYYAMIDGSDVLYKLSGGAELFEAVSAEFASKLVCPVSADDAVSFKVEIGSNVYFYNIADIENNDALTDIYNSITSIVNEGKTDAQKGELLLKTTFDLGDEEMILNIYKYDETYYIASFDKWDNLLVPCEKIDNIIKDLQS